MYNTIYRSANNSGRNYNTNTKAIADHLRNAEEEIKAMVAARLAAKEAVAEVIVKKDENKSKVCVIANKLKGMSRSEAFRKAWAIVKAETVETKIAGVTAGRRQEALEHLTHYDADKINITLERQADNEHDNNAIAVVVSVQSKGSYTIGYLPRMLAVIIAPLIDAGKAVRATFKEIVGKYQSYHNYGMAVSVSI